MTTSSTLPTVRRDLDCGQLAVIDGRSGRAIIMAMLDGPLDAAAVGELAVALLELAELADATR
jgi:hypothetical protein